jgi:hypothetical protein
LKEIFDKNLKTKMLNVEFGVNSGDITLNYLVLSGALILLRRAALHQRKVELSVMSLELSITVYNA